MNLKKLALLVGTLLLLSLGCAFITGIPTELAPSPSEENQPQSPISENRCGDGICDGPESPSNCPSDCVSVFPPADIGPGSGLPPANEENTYWVINPSSNARLFVRALYPGNWGGENLPTLVIVPGGAGTIDPGKVLPLAANRFAIVIFDPDGRGKCDGEENLDGYIQQDGLTAVIRAAGSLPGVDRERIGVVSYSYGITMASGALARHPDLQVQFLIDWEGPADRYDTTLGCPPDPHIAWPDCNDDAAWAEREALTFIPQVSVPYQRLQSEQDHVQPNPSHAIKMVNAAVRGGVPWVRLNDLPPNQTYDPQNPPPLFPEKADATLENLIASFAQEMFNLIP
jgi:hypothetical protein